MVSCSMGCKDNAVARISGMLGRERGSVGKGGCVIAPNHIKAQKKVTVYSQVLIAWLVGLPVHTILDI